MKLSKICIFKSVVFSFGLLVHGAVFGGQAAYKVFGKQTSMADVKKADQATFYDLEKKAYDKVESAAKEAYLEEYWVRQAKAKSTSVEAYRIEYFKKNVKISDKEVAETLAKFANHPRLSKLPKKEQEQQVREYLEDREQRDLIDSIISQGIKNKELLVMMTKPTEPIYRVDITKDDIMRYGPKAEDNAPQGCKGDQCQITIVEFSEFQCPFCARVIPDAKRVLAEYKGKLRWVMKDFPLSFHDRARPAAIAARCAGSQGMFWKMYEKLFANQTKLGDADFEKYAKEIGANMEDWSKCIANPGEIEKVIDDNFQQGVKVGVTGTPAFFINGRRLSGALPFSEFKKVIDEELAKNEKS